MRSTLTLSLKFLVLAAIAAATQTAIASYATPRLQSVLLASLLLTASFTAIEYHPDHSLLVSLYRSARAVFLILALALAVTSFGAFRLLRNAVAGHPNPTTRQLVESWTDRVLAGFLALGVLVGMLTLYGLWKFFATRLAESRIGILKDLLIRVEDALTDQSRLVRSEETTQLCMTSLLSMLELSPWNLLLRSFRLVRRDFAFCHVLLFTPDLLTRSYQIEQLRYRGPVPMRVGQALDEIRLSHRPAFLDTEMLEQAIKAAKESGGGHWLQNYLRTPGRDTFISACGWIGAKKEALFSTNAKLSLAFDHSTVETFRSRRQLEPQELRWLKVGSFIGCPVWAEGGGSENSAVLMAVKNVVGGFVPEDQEIVIAVSKIIGGIKRAQIDRGVQ